MKTNKLLKSSMSVALALTISSITAQVSQLKLGQQIAI